MKRFGTARGASSYWNQVAVPVGQRCAWCEEAVGESDSGFVVPHVSEEELCQPYHEECFIRSMVGSVAHQLGECRCYGGTREDAPGITRRQAARDAHAMFLMN